MVSLTNVTPIPHWPGGGPAVLTARLEAACYFLSSPDADQCTHAEEFNAAIEELVSMIEKAQQPDGYLNVYFVVVDPDGKIKNLRDFHELCEYLPP